MEVTFDTYVGQKMWEICGEVAVLDLQRTKLKMLEAMAQGGVTRSTFMENFRTAYGLPELEDARVYDIWASFDVLTSQCYDFSINKWISRKAEVVVPAVAAVAESALVQKLEDLMKKQEERFAATLEAMEKGKGKGEAEDEIPALSLDSLGDLEKREHKPAWLMAGLDLLRNHIEGEARMKSGDEAGFDLAGGLWELLFKNDREYRAKYARGEGRQSKGVEIFMKDGKEFFRSKHGKEIATSSRPHTECDRCRRNGKGTIHHWYFQCPLWS
jgi:hypothetical protein